MLEVFKVLAVLAETPPEAHDGRSSEAENKAPGQNAVPCSLGFANYFILFILFIYYLLDPLWWHGGLFLPLDNLEDLQVPRAEGVIRNKR